MEFAKYQIEEKFQGLTIEQYLRQVLMLSARRVQKLTRVQGLYLNDKKSFLQKKLRYKDILKIATWQDCVNVVAQAGMELEIVYENVGLLVVNKPAGLLVHPAGQTQSGTLINYLAQRYIAQPEVQLYPLHRLDRDTSGCVLFAKNIETYRLLEQQMQAGDIKRIYYAIVQGRVDGGEHIINKPLGIHPFYPNRRVVSATGKEAITIYRLKEQLSERYSLLEVELLTGRTHQIRVHLADIGLPIVGDGMYGVRILDIKRQALHAGKMVFRDPTTEALVESYAEFMLDMNSFIEKNRKTK